MLEKLPDRIRYRKNLLPAILVTILLWFFWVTMLLFVPPESIFVTSGFFVLTFLTILFTASLALGRARRGVLAGVGVLSYMGLNYYGIANYLNAILIAGVLFTLEYYFSTR